MMKLLRKEIKFNELSFQPEVVFTIVAPLEPLKDGLSQMSDEMCMALGKELFDCVARGTQE